MEQNCTGVASSAYTLRCGRTGESQTIYVCPHHAKQMPAVDDDLVTVEPATEYWDEPSCDFLRD